MWPTAHQRNIVVSDIKTNIVGVQIDTLFFEFWWFNFAPIQSSDGRFVSVSYCVLSDSYPPRETLFELSNIKYDLNDGCEVLSDFTEVGRSIVLSFSLLLVNTAVQESLNPSSKVKFTQDTVVQCFHERNKSLQTNTIGSPPLLPLIPTLSNTSMLSSSCCADGFPRLTDHSPCTVTPCVWQQKNISIFHTLPRPWDSFVLALLCSCFHHESIVRLMWG